MSKENLDEGTFIAVGDEEEAANHQRDVPVKEFFHWIYRFFYSKTLGLVLILIFAAYAVVGSVIPQSAPGTYADPAAKAAFLQDIGELYGGWTPILNFLGFFHVWTSLGFYVVVVMLALSIAACTVHRIPELIKRKHDPRVHVAKRFFDRARYRATIPTSAPAPQALEVAGEVLKGDRFRVIPDPKDKNAFYADRFSWAGIGTVVAHSAFIIILAAFVVSNVWGIEEELAIPVGGDVELGHGTNLTAHAVSFTDSYTDEGQPSDYVTELQILEGDKVVAEQEVRVNAPLDYGGFRFHQSTFGIAADVKVADGKGQTIFEGSVPLKWQSNQNQNAVGRFDLPESNIEVIVVTAASGATASQVPVGAALFEVYDKDSGTALGHTLVKQGDTGEDGGWHFSFERERSYTGVTARQDPGAWVMWVGSTLLVVGMSITFLFPYRRLWVRVDRDEDGDTGQSEAGQGEADEGAVNEGAVGEGGVTRIRFGAVARLDYAYQRLFEKVVGQVEARLDEQAVEE